MTNYDYSHSYWEDNGKYQPLYVALKTHVPERGRSDSIPSELLRCACNIYYDVYNNGGCNLQDGRQEEVLFMLYVARWDDCPTDVCACILKAIRGHEPSYELEKMMDWVITYTANKLIPA